MNRGKVPASFMIGVVLLSWSEASAAEQPSKEARVTRIIRDVTILKPGAEKRAAALEDKLADGTVVFTGDASRSELTFSDLTITRLGANTAFSFNNGGHNIRLDSGSILFHVPKNSGGGRIDTSAVSVTVTGATTLFKITLSGRSQLTVMKGSAQVTLVRYPSESSMIQAGQMLDVSAGASKIPAPLPVDLNLITKRDPLYTDFGLLPGEDAAAASPKGQPGTDRGVVGGIKRPTTVSPTPLLIPGSNPTLPPPARTVAPSTPPPTPTAPQLTPRSTPATPAKTATPGPRATTAPKPTLTPTPTPAPGPKPIPRTPSQAEPTVVIIQWPTPTPNGSPAPRSSASPTGTVKNISPSPTPHPSPKPMPTQGRSPTPSATPAKKTPKIEPRPTVPAATPSASEAPSAMPIPERTPSATPTPYVPPPILLPPSPTEPPNQLISVERAKKAKPGASGERTDSGPEKTPSPTPSATSEPQEQSITHGPREGVEGTASPSASPGNEANDQGHHSGSEGSTHGKHKATPKPKKKRASDQSSPSQ